MTSLPPNIYTLWWNRGGIIEFNLLMFLLVLPLPYASFDARIFKNMEQKKEGAIK